jgi:cell division protein FtsN
MVNRKSSPKKERRRHTFQFTFSSLLLLSIGFVFILAWVFSLGIMVGRGLLPNTLNPFSSAKEKTVKASGERKTDRVRPLRDEELTFYDQLVHKKQRAKKQSLSRGSPRGPVGKPAVAHPQKDRGNYSVQVAALKDKGKTERLMERLTKLGYPAYYYQTRVDTEIYYRIRCGPFRDLDEVRKCAERLADKQGFKPLIIYPSKNDEGL